MRTFVTGAALIGGVAALPDKDVTTMWKEFRAHQGRKYGSVDEEYKRFGIFAENMKRMESMQKVDPEATYTHLSPMADLSEAEFSQYNTLRVSADTLTQHAARAAVNRKSVNARTLPSKFDWREKGAVNKVKNQKQCGSCWAFAVVANVEGNNFVKNGKLENLSEQELVSCDTEDQGCNGGLPSLAYKFMIDSNTGLESESDYPYVGRKRQCKAKKSKENVFLDDWKAISEDEDEIAQALIENGPLAIGINATWMQFYGGGIADPFMCNPRKLDHGVAIVGFGEENGKKYWVIRNSWGQGWGEKGYYRIARGKGKCGLNTMVTTALVSDKDQNMFV